MNIRQTPDLVTLLAEQRIIRHPIGLSVVAAVREELKAQSSPGQDAEFLRLPGPYNTWRDWTRRRRIAQKFDSPMDTLCVGSAYRMISGTGVVCEVKGLSLCHRSLNFVEIATAGTAYDDAETV